ncbi:unnamed protein product (macronuclear) [Paramecium tetraurelia]|uniref:Cysteine-rich PDZ-binding protein n=3 Tax=Paramecium TaxID=5884 RepID=A0BX18_PARTE|nr:uncharacterized protein GSPATT00032937001 [Paramecium tetraurelia]CAD8120491.1 unnamed protein product [Paramecium sonneborni]CAD8185800.1 unnamed protein product [Paramecium octaurelia]CAK63085.1 unnamed protein product [Paramecium tetraurelia]|eukprot:XP_001430483.1 hypothetical protein (macronuclear) [Paramecium tetraurelia strain d4-2]
MVCDKCQEKLTKLATPDVWDKDNKNKKPGMILPSFNKNKFDPMGQNKCQKCKKRQVQKNEKFCQECAYKDGICKMCGVKVLETKFYRQSNV